MIEFLNKWQGALLAVAISMGAYAFATHDDRLLNLEAAAGKNIELMAKMTATLEVLTAPNSVPQGAVRLDSFKEFKDLSLTDHERFYAKQEELDKRLRAVELALASRGIRTP